MICAQFPETEFSDTLKAVMLDDAGRYFTEQFGGSCSFVFDLFPTVTLPENAEYYGRNSTDKKDALLYKAVQDACIASEKAIDFRNYDCDGDGTVEGVFVLFAGESEISADNPDLIWPQQNTLSALSSPLFLQGKKIDRFCVCAESDSFLTFCHEYGHILGLHDLYDTDGEASGGTSESLWGRLPLMDAGTGNAGSPPNFCAIELDELGLGCCEELSLGDYELEPIEKGGRYLKAATENKGEYFLFECRDNQGWDKSIGGSGLVIYHIDKSSRNAGWSDYYRTFLSANERWSKDQVNCRPDHQCADLCEADSTSSISTVFFPQRERVSFGSDTKPAFKAWDGTPSRLSIVGMTRGSGGSIRFSVVEPVSITDMVVYQDAATLRWKTDEAIGKEDFTLLISTDENGMADTTKVASGVRCCTVEHLKPATDYTIKVQICRGSSEAFSAHVKARTKSWRKELQPYIYMGSVSRGERGKIQRGSHIPLRVCNAPDVVRVTWTFDGKAISCNSDGYYEILSEGTLKAVALHEDGSTDIIVKKIVLE